LTDSGHASLELLELAAAYFPVFLAKCLGVLFKRMLELSAWVWLV
jgi:hypothetical protein